jgi:ATP-binding cassette subfamily B protein/ATP-binding cassette subfamily C protein
MTRPTTPPNPLRLTAALARQHPAALAGNLAAWAFIHATPIAHGLIMKGVFDALAPAAGAASSPWSLLALLAVLDLSRIAALAGGIWLWAGLWSTAVMQVRRNVLAHLATAPGTRAIPDSSSEAVTRLRDDVDDVGQYLENAVDAGGLLVYVVGALAVMAGVDPLLTGAALLPLVATLALTAALRPRIRRVRARMREATGRVTDFVGETASAAQAIKLAGRIEPVVARFAALGAERRRTALRDTWLAETVRSLNDNMVHVAMGLVLLLAAGALRSGDFGVGDFALFVTYLPRLTGAMSFFGAMAVHQRRTGVAYERLAALMVDAPADRAVAGPPARLDRPAPAWRSPPRPRERFERLTVRGLTARHPSGRGIDGVDLDVARGETVVVTGRVGAGKSTLLRALLGLMPVRAGTILWNGSPVDDPGGTLVPPRTAYVAQTPRLFSDLLRHNVALGRDEAGLARALDLAVMGPDLARMERGLDTEVGARGVRLSGGQRQRSAAARSFMQEAELLVVDDLSSALDVETERRLWQGLAAEEASCLVVSHRRAALRHADRIVLLADGRVADAGTLAELLGRSAEMRALWAENHDAPGLLERRA